MNSVLFASFSRRTTSNLYCALWFEFPAFKEFFFLLLGVFVSVQGSSGYLNTITALDGWTLLTRQRKKEELDERHDDALRKVLTFFSSFFR